MKWRIEKKYIRAGAIALAVIVLAILFQFSLEHEARMEEHKLVISNTLMPIILGFILAYLLNPVLNFFEHYIFTPIARFIWRREEKIPTRRKFSRALGVFCTMILFLVIIIGGLYMVIPQVYQSLSKIVSDAPSYYNTLQKWLNSIEPEQTEFRKYLMVAMDRLYSQAITYLNQNILPNMDKIVAGITSGIVGGLKMLMNFILAIIISVYVMAEKETLISVGKKLTYSLFNTKNANGILRGARYADRVFGGFVNGKIIDSFIIGVLCYVFMRIVEFDYPVLISIIVGVTNIIPYFGPFIGAIPSVLILLMVNVREGLVFAIFVVVLQQLDGNIIGPLILGDRLNMSSMWILFAILIGGGFFGVPGMILGAPTFACIYALVSALCRSRLQEKQLPAATEAYYGVDKVEEGGIIHMMKASEGKADKKEKRGLKKKENPEEEKAEHEKAEHEKTEHEK